MDRMQLTLHSQRKFTLLLLACYIRVLNTAVLLRWVTLRKCSQTSSPADEWMCCCSHCATRAGGSFFYLDPIVMAKKHKCHLVTIPPSLQYELRYLGSPQHLSSGTLLGQVTSYVVVFTDASLMRWWGAPAWGERYVVWALQGKTNT